MLGKIEGMRRRGQRRKRWLHSITDSTDMSLSKLQEIVETEKHGELQSMGLQTVGHDLVIEQQQLLFCPQKGWKVTGGCRGRCKCLEAPSANVRADAPYLRISPPSGVKPKPNLLHLTDNWAVQGDEISGCQAGGGRCQPQSRGR